MKTKIAMMFGGKSVEHEVSVISGIQALLNMDTEKYEVIPVYMTKNNEMYVGEEIGKIEAYKNIDELWERIGDTCFKVEREETPDIPSKIYQTYDVQLTEEQKKLYLQLQEMHCTDNSSVHYSHYLEHIEYFPVHRL